MTIAENVAQAELGIDRERGKKCLSLAGLEQKITQLPKEIDTHLGQVYEDGIRLPGGEAQRLMLARALYKSAPVIILDDPQSGILFYTIRPKGGRRKGKEVSSVRAFVNILFSPNVL